MRLPLGGAAGTKLSRRFTAGAGTFGFGLGGLLDGIVLHHLLQWHNMASARIDNRSLDGLQANLLWDAVFHLSTTALLVVGVVLLQPAWSGRDPGAGNRAAALGLTLLGWGAFNVVDQLVFHLALGLHDIRQHVADPAVYNWSFFAFGLLLIAVGATVLRTRGRPAPRVEPAQEA